MKITAPPRSTSRSPLEQPWRVAQVSDLRGQAESKRRAESLSNTSVPFVTFVLKP